MFRRAKDDEVPMILAQASHSVLLNTDAPWRADWEWGLPLIILTVILHVFGLGLVRRVVVHIYSDGAKRRFPMVVFGVVMATATLLATVLHAIETGIWAFTYRFLGALPDFRRAMLYSLGAMTTYGHTNLGLETQWQMMGAIEALNGWLLFGLSTAFLFWTVQEVAAIHSGNERSRL
jgi:hypothetical protein